MTGAAYTELDAYLGWRVRLRTASGTFEARRPVDAGTARARSVVTRGGVAYETVSNRSLAGLKKAIDRLAPAQAPIAAWRAPEVSYGHDLHPRARVTVLRSERVGADERLVVAEGSWTRRLDRPTDTYRVWDDELVSRVDALTERVALLLAERAALVATAVVVTPELLRERGRALPPRAEGADAAPEGGR